ncbi:MAG: family 20 glycosylhydrolase [Mucilaginibacter sp.]
MIKFYLHTLLSLLLFTSICCYATAQNAITKYNIIPYPVKLIARQGNFIINLKTQIIAQPRFANEARQLNQIIKAGTGYSLKTGTTIKSNTIEFHYSPNVKETEGYKLDISAHHIVISASNAAGAFYAVETIRQLLPVPTEGKQTRQRLNIPQVYIEDAPAYAWRGMHLDVSRHFFSINYLRKFIDVMALYKMNKFHLHLTDDQGWRIQIKKYPKLTEEGAWRTFDNHDSVCMQRATENPDFKIDSTHIIEKDGKKLYGGYYTQQQMKDFVAYAAERHIDIIPEIDMPGHMMAAINSYPFLTCNGENKWGALFSRPICPCNEQTFEFAQNVYSEIMDIFPSKYIHIGGDEVDRSDWGKSEACKTLMQQEGIKDLPGLQSYFINRMEKFFNSKGRKLIGWDEVLEGGISSTAIIMYWRTWVPDAPAKAAMNGNKVIMSPGSPLYFDNPADKNSLYNIYHFNPIPASLNQQQARQIIGAQANIWTEYIPSEKRADYMFMPRMTALAELLWTNDTNDYQGYTQRLIQQYARLDALHINYRLPDLDGIVDNKIFVTSDTLNITPPLSTLVVRYTSNGALPDNNSPLLNNLVITKPQTIRLAAFTPNGKRGDVYSINYTQQSLAKPQTGTFSPGLSVEYFKGYFKSAKLIREGKADSTFIVSNIFVPKSVNAPSFGLKYRGYIDVPQDGIYTFYFTCDDGGILNIAGYETVNNDGLHSAIEKSGQAALKKGPHPIALDFIEGGGGFTLKLKYSKDGSQPVDVPSEWLKH